MEFSIHAPSDPRSAAENAKFAEERGFDQIWFTDYPMSFGDVFVCLAIAAQTTERIRLGAGVAAASNRIAPVTVSSIATINALSQGRAVLGFGSGTRSALGLAPLSISDLKGQLRTIRALLDNGAADYEERGGGRAKIRFLHREREFMKLDPPIPLYVAASAPKMAALAGEFGDGLISGGISPTPEAIAELLVHFADGARIAERSSAPRSLVLDVPVCVLRLADSFNAPRVISRMGFSVLMHFRLCALGLVDTATLPAGIERMAEIYKSSFAEVPHEEQHLAVWERHHTLASGERRYVTPEAIKFFTLCGARGDLISRIKALEQAGVTEIAVSTSLDDFRETVEEISRELIGRV
ncbi:MAG TPA: LLM class flavin-dependent oxidoreductase [Candidatus Binataceae bacterium]